MDRRDGSTGGHGLLRPQMLLGTGDVIRTGFSVVHAGIPDVVVDVNHLRFAS